MYLEQKIDRILEILEATSVAPVTGAVSATPKRRGRPPGATVTAEASALPATNVVESAPVESAAPAAVTAPTAEADPFAEAVPAAVVVTKDQVREEAVKLAKATSQDNAVSVIKNATGVSFPDLKPEQYAVAYSALVNAPRGEADPFTTGETASVTAAQADAPSLDDVKAALRKAQARTGANKVQDVVVAHGGVTIDTNPGPAHGTKKVSVNALAVSAYAAVIAAVNALPDTKTGK